MIVFPNGKRLVNDPSVFIGKRENVRGTTRESVAMTIHGSNYDELKALFSDGAVFGIENDVPDYDEDGKQLFIDGIPQFKTQTYDKSAYNVAGDITDKRDGSFVVLMGVPTDHERLEEENARLLLELGGVQSE